LQIEFLTLIKAKSIQEFNDHYVKKLIIHIIYLNLIVQNYMIDITFMLITWLNQHQMIFKKTWMNKIDLVIDMQIDFLWFSNFTLNSKSIVLLTSNKIIMKQKSLTFTHILKRSFTIFQLSLKSLSFSQFNEKLVKLIEQLKLYDITLTNVKIFKLMSDSMNIAMIETATYRMLVKWSDIKIFAIIILKIDWLITTVENKSEKVNLHKLFHAEVLKQVKVKLFSEYHDYLDIFDQTMINQLSLHHFYDHKIELINEEMSSWSRLYQMFDHKL